MKVEEAHKACAAEIRRLMEIETVHKDFSGEIDRLRNGRDKYRQRYNENYELLKVADEERERLQEELATTVKKHDKLEKDTEVVADKYLKALERIKDNEEDYEFLSVSYKKAVALLKENRIDFPDELVIEDVVDGNEDGAVDLNGGSLVSDVVRVTPDGVPVSMEGVITGHPLIVEDPVILPNVVEGDAPSQAVASGGNASNVTEVHTETLLLD